MKIKECKGEETTETSGANARLEGQISKWEKDRGFGWVQCEQGSFFAHIKEFEKGFIPREGDEVNFVMGLDPKGRPCVKDVTSPRMHQWPTLLHWAKLLGLLALPLMANFKLPIAPWKLPLAMLPISIGAWLLFRHDKQRAYAGRWRVSETELHGLELFGGWPGAFLAQQKFRHKTRKVSYQAIFWSIVFLYQLASLDAVLDHWMWNEASAMWTENMMPSIE